MNWRRARVFTTRGAHDNSQLPIPQRQLYFGYPGVIVWNPVFSNASVPGNSTFLGFSSWVFGLEELFSNFLTILREEEVRFAGTLVALFCHVFFCHVVFVSPPQVHVHIVDVTGHLPMFPPGEGDDAVWASGTMRNKSFVSTSTLGSCVEMDCGCGALVRHVVHPPGTHNVHVLQAYH